MRERESALIALTEQPIENILGPVADLILEDSSDRAHGTCLDLLERIGAVVTLADIRADGWFEQFGKQISQIDKICEVIGERFLAYSIILGIQLHSLTTDPRYPANTSVEFTLDDDQLQTLPLAEFRIRVVQAVIQGNRVPVEPSLPLSVEEAAGLIGGRNLLLAPLFDISLEQLVLASLNPEEPRALVGYITEEGFNFIDLRDFDELIRGRVRRDLAGTGEEPFKLDLAAVQLAKKAFEDKDFDQVIATLETWPGLLSILLKTPTMRALEDDQRLAIAEGLEILGAAFEQRDREAWSEELYKLGLQFEREGEIAGRLFHRLGLLLIHGGRFAEAIGSLRRALNLGISADEINPVLGRAFLRTNRVIAAVALLENVSSNGVDSKEVEADLAEAHKRIKDADLTWDIPPIRDPAEPTSD